MNRGTLKRIEKKAIATKQNLKDWNWVNGNEYLDKFYWCVMYPLVCEVKRQRRRGIYAEYGYQFLPGIPFEDGGFSGFSSLPCYPTDWGKSTEELFLNPVPEFKMTGDIVEYNYLDFRNLFLCYILMIPPLDKSLAGYQKKVKNHPHWDKAEEEIKENFYSHFGRNINEYK